MDVVAEEVMEEGSQEIGDLDLDETPAWEHIKRLINKLCRPKRNNCKLSLKLLINAWKAYKSRPRQWEITPTALDA